MNRCSPIAVLFACLLASCSSKKKVDLIVQHASIYTVDSSFSQAQAMAVAGGRIVATGSNEAIAAEYTSATVVDAGGKFIYPGFIDAHAHFVGYALGLQKADLTGTDSWDSILARLKEFAASHPEGWLVGRGWDQNDWAIKNFPDNAALNQLFPDRPVVLTRVDGHAVIANQKALDLAGVKAGTTLVGGSVETKNGKLTGILIDNATDLVTNMIPSPAPATIASALDDAQKNCFATGLTTVDDCGLEHEMVDMIDSLQRNGKLQMRVYAMLSDNPANFAFAAARGKIKTDQLTMRAFKVYADGALGSRGACLLQPYNDKPGWTGFLLSAASHFDSVAAVLHKMDFQMCTHAIGDSGNRVILQTYTRHLKGKNDLRWRIEHAQVVADADFPLFGNSGIVPSVQPTHATSDMYWAGDRLGARVKTAYAYKQLLQQNGWIALGTDFPVEDISPFKTFYAAVVRKDAKGWPAGGFQTGNALSREEALRGMTIWAAKANFEENEKGSIEKGKWADFIVLDQDLMKTTPEKLLATQVISTWIGGKMVYQKK